MNRRNIIVFIGPPGSGKGSLSQLCVKRLGWHQLSTGNLCREHIGSGTELGKEMDFTLKSGKLISDSLMVAMVDEWLSRPEVMELSTIIFDGFPRTLPQAKALHRLLSQKDDTKLHVVKLVVPQEQLLQRLLTRYVCENGKCQQVYSSNVLSLMQPIQKDLCNECDSPLVRRSDDAHGAIVERLRIYGHHEIELFSYYEAIEQDVKELLATMPLDDVYASLRELMGTVGI